MRAYKVIESINIIREYEVMADSETEAKNIIRYDESKIKPIKIKEAFYNYYAKGI